jgi:hypothetical protein
MLLQQSCSVFVRFSVAPLQLNVHFQRSTSGRLRSRQVAFFYVHTTSILSALEAFPYYGVSSCAAQYVSAGLPIVLAGFADLHFS